MKAYAYNESGQFICEVDCQPNPLEFGEWIVPAQCTIVAPPKPKAGKITVWNGTKWVFQSAPVEAEPETSETQTAE